MTLYPLSQKSMGIAGFRWLSKPKAGCNSNSMAIKAILYFFDGILKTQCMNFKL